MAYDKVELRQKLMAQPTLESNEAVYASIIDLISQHATASHKKEIRQVLVSLLSVLQDEIRENQTPEQFKKLAIPTSMLCRLLSTETLHRNRMLLDLIYKICYLSCYFDTDVHQALIKANLIEVSCKVSLGTGGNELFQIICLLSNVLADEDQHLLFQRALALDYPFLDRGLRSDDLTQKDASLMIIYRMTKYPTLYPTLIPQTLKALFHALTFTDLQKRVFTTIDALRPAIAAHLTSDEMTYMMSALRDPASDHLLLLNLACQLLDLPGVPGLLLSIKATTPTFIHFLHPSKPSRFAMLALRLLMQEDKELAKTLTDLKIVPRLLSLVSPTERKIQPDILMTLEALSENPYATRAILEPVVISRLFELVDENESPYFKLPALSALERVIRGSRGFECDRRQSDILLKCLSPACDDDSKDKVCLIISHCQHIALDLSMARVIMPILSRLAIREKEFTLLCSILAQLQDLVKTHPDLIPMLTLALKVDHFFLLENTSEWVQSIASKLFLFCADSCPDCINLSNTKQMRVLLAFVKNNPETRQGLFNLLNQEKNSRFFFAAGGATFLEAALSIPHEAEKAALIFLARPHLLPIHDPEKMRPFVQLLRQEIYRDRVANILIFLAEKHVSHAIIIQHSDEMNALVPFLSHRNQKMKKMTVAAFLSLSQRPAHAALMWRSLAIAPLVREIRTPANTNHASQILNRIAGISDAAKAEINALKASLPPLAKIKRRREPLTMAELNECHHMTEEDNLVRSIAKRQTTFARHAEKKQQKRMELTNKIQAIESDILGLAAALSEDPELERLRAGSTPRKLLKRLEAKRDTLLQKETERKITVPALDVPRTVCLREIESIRRHGHLFIIKKLYNGYEQEQLWAIDRLLALSTFSNEFKEDIQSLIYPSKLFELRQYASDDLWIKISELNLLLNLNIDDLEENPCGFIIYPNMVKTLPEEILSRAEPWRVFARDLFSEAHLTLVGSQTDYVMAPEFNPLKDWDLSLFCLAAEQPNFDDLKIILENFKGLRSCYAVARGDALHYAFRLPFSPQPIDLSIVVYPQCAYTIQQCIRISQVERRLTHKSQILDLNTAEFYAANTSWRTMTKGKLVKPDVLDYGYIIYDMVNDRLKRLRDTQSTERLNDPFLRNCLRQMKDRPYYEQKDIINYAKKHLAKKNSDNGEPYSHQEIALCLKEILAEHDLALPPRRSHDVFFPAFNKPKEMETFRPDRTIDSHAGLS